MYPCCGYFLVTYQNLINEFSKVRWFSNGYYMHATYFYCRHDHISLLRLEIETHLSSTSCTQLCILLTRFICVVVVCNTKGTRIDKILDHMCFIQVGRLGTYLFTCSIYMLFWNSYMIWSTYIYDLKLPHSAVHKYLDYMCSIIAFHQSLKKIAIFITKIDLKEVMTNISTTWWLGHFPTVLILLLLLPILPQCTVAFL